MDAADGSVGHDTSGPGGRRGRGADLTGSGRPAFLVLLAAADNTPGFLVTRLEGRWSCAVFNGPYPPSSTS